MCACGQVEINLTLNVDVVCVQEKIDRLNQLEHLLQEQSFKVSSFREDKVRLLVFPLF